MVQFSQHFGHSEYRLWILGPLLVRAVVVGQCQFKFLLGSVDVAELVPSLGQTGMQFHGLPER